ncbi:MAG: hypothetical protein RR101_11255 [Burkholderiaceae bacterium]
MIEELDALADRIRELAQMIYALRTENQDLRARVASQEAELAAMRERVEIAGARLDSLVLSLSEPAPSTEP